MKIVSVGCSFTEGTGVGRKNAYTRHLADLCNCEYENYGESGHSNQYIFRKTIELIKNWNTDDILIIQWTAPNRQEVITKEGYLFYSPFSNFMSLEFLFGQDVANNPNAAKYDNNTQNEIIKNYSNLIDEYTERLTNDKYSDTLSFNYQVALFNMLENLNIKHIHFYGWEAIKLDIKQYVNDKFLTESFGYYTETLQNEHPNLDGHIKWANYLFGNLKKFNYI
jgi:hypothetical protein